MEKILALPQQIVLKNVKIKVSTKTLLIFGFVLILSLLSFYIFQVNSVIKNSYLIKGYEKRMSDASLENSNLKINFATTNSLDNIETLVATLGFEKISEVKYIQVLGTQMVANK